MTVDGLADPGAAVDHMARAGARNVAASVVSALSGVAIVLVVTNVFPRATSGTLFTSTALFLVLVSICLLGTDVGLARWVPRYLVAGRAAAVGRALRAAAIPVVATSVVVALVLLVGARPIAEVVAEDGSGTTVDDLATALRVLAACLPVAVLYESALAAARAHGTMTPTIVVERLGRSAAQVLGIVAVAVAGGGAVALVAAWAAPYVIALVAAGAWLVAIRRRVAPPAPDEPSTADVSGAFWRFTAPRAVGQVLQVALQRVDIVVVSALLGVADAAVYAAATRFLVFGQIGTQAVQQVLQPQLSALLAADDLERAGALFRTATAWIMAMAWPVYLSFASLAPVVMGVFGEGYDSGATTVAVLSLAMLLATAAGPVDVALLMSGRSGASTLNGLAALVVDLALVALLAPWLGITGAALAWAAAIVVRNLLPLVQVRRSLGISAAGPASRTVALVVGLPYAVVGPVVHLGAANDHPEAAALVPVAAAVAIAGLWRTRETTGLTNLVAALRRRRS